MMEQNKELICGILDAFENVLDHNGIQIPDDARQGEDGEACLYGDTYFALEEKVAALIEQEEEAIYQRVKTRRTVEIAKSYVKMNCESNIIAKLEEGDYLTLANRYLSKMGDDCTPEYVWKEVIEEFIKEKKFFVGLLGDETGLYAMSNLVDVSELAFFDDLEYQCWELFEKYAEKFGVHIVQTDENDIDFYTAKQIQDAILKQFEDAGIKFIYEKKDE